MIKTLKNLMNNYRLETFKTLINAIICLKSDLIHYYQCDACKGPRTPTTGHLAQVRIDMFWVRLKILLKCILLGER